LSSTQKSIKRGITIHLKKLGIYSNEKSFSKENIRYAYSEKRKEVLENSKNFIEKNLDTVIPFLADGREIEPHKISPRLCLVKSNSIDSIIFKVITLTWSIPVSSGFGRRLRFLIWDNNTEKVMGIIALGDPVFNLKARDETIGWSFEDRKKRLVNIMDAYILGAVPPYNMILGGKLIASLIKTIEVKKIFQKKYGDAKGIISESKKKPHLLAVTTTSALGRSSVYNRLRINGYDFFQSIGFTAGYGHFHISDKIFNDIRAYLQFHEHPYSNNYKYGDGPNWRLRTIRTGLEKMGVDREALNHGIKREVFISTLANNAYEILRGEVKKPNYSTLLDLKTVNWLALERWVIPRSSRDPSYKEWKKEDINKQLFL
jgi:hypothetical protein